MTARLSFLFGRAVPLGLFGFLVAIQGELAIAGLQQAAVGELDRGATMYLINRILTLSFFSFLFIIYLVRSRAVAKNHSPLAVAAAMTGTFVLYLLYLVPQSRTTDLWVLATSDMLLSAGILLALYAVSYLRQRFSIVPEARGLVTTGPYALVRHPIYLGEITAGVGLVLPTIASLHLAVLGIFVAAQIIRTYYEEQVLRKAFPQYAAYASSTRRIIPFLF